MLLELVYLVAGINWTVDIDMWVTINQHPLRLEGERTMDKALFISMSGAKQNMYSQQAHANNLANVNTVGFRQVDSKPDHACIWCSLKSLRND